MSGDDARRAQEAYDAAVRSAEETMAAAMRAAWEAHGGVGNFDEDWLEFGTSPEGKAFAAAMDPIQEAFDAAVGSAQEAYGAATRAQEARGTGGGSLVS